MQKKQTILVVASLLVVVLSVTLAYFTAQIIGKGKDVSVSSADLKIIFTDTDGNIEGSNITPGWSNSKTFTVKNESNETYKYNIVIQDLINTFVTNGYLQYKITSTNGGYNMTEFKDVPKSSVATDKILAYSVSIDVGVTQTYTVEFKYANDESVDQSEDMGKTLSGTLYIEKGTEKPFNGGTLVEAIKHYNPTIKTRTDFSSVFTETNTGTLYKATESIAGNTPKDVYYFAGDAKNNWVKFGKYQNDLIRYRGYYSTTGTSFYSEYSTMDECTSASSFNKNCTEYKYANTGDDIYWRIIRTNYDGSIRLLYAGTNPDTTEVHIGKSSFNTSYNSPKYVGYKYGEDTSPDIIRNNTTDSTIKEFIDSWYKNSLTNYTKYLSTSAVYCNDRSLGTGQKYSTSSKFNFSSYYRMDWDTDGAKANPSYNCTDIRDAFSVDNTNAKLTYPVSLMTADEIAFAGGIVDKKMNTPYAWFTNNSVGTQVLSHWWSLSPSNWDGTRVVVWNWDSNYVNMNGNNVSTEIDVRPAISLKSCTLWTSGNGAPETPYEISTTSGC